MRILAVLTAMAIALPMAGQPQAAAPALNLVVLQGEGAINNIRQRTAREPIVEVQDENHKPVAGAVVVFALSENGAGGAFANGSHTLTMMTDAQGRAVARGFRPNNVQGQYQMRVTASKNGQTTNIAIAMSNIAAAGAAAGAGGVSGKLIAIIAVAAGAAVAGGVVAATRGGGGGNSATIPPPTVSLISISPGTGTVGAPR